jgi:hypothetical protein
MLNLLCFVMFINDDCHCDMEAGLAKRTVAHSRDMAMSKTWFDVPRPLKPERSATDFRMPNKEEDWRIP